MGISVRTLWLACDAEDCNAGDALDDHDPEARRIAHAAGWRQHPETTRHWYCPKHAYLADVPDCPGRLCPMCSGEACLTCRDNRKAPCTHDVIERHASSLPEARRARRVAKLTKLVKARKEQALSKHTQNCGGIRK